VVVDYDWCIGCRYCMTACSYLARHFNWTTPQLDPEEINPATNYLGNRARARGVVEKRHFCTRCATAWWSPA
jgi:molybdopterin-containing oxidoreductase family iron-sulfur binding subunit